MTQITTTNFDAALKQIYRPQNMQKLVYSKRPLLGWLPKFENFGGRNMPIVQLYGNPQGRSAVFSTAQSGVTAAGVEDFLITRVQNHSVVQINGDTVESSMNEEYSFLSLMKIKMDLAINSLADDIETSLYRDTNGYRAQVGSCSVAPAMVITLLQPEEIVNFEVGMVLVADNDIDAASLRATPASLTVTGINRSSGTLTTNYDNDPLATDWAASDYLFVSGDQNAKISGLMGWLPSSVTATAFFGVDRTVDTRLAGIYHDGSAGTVEEALIDAHSKVSREGGSPDAVFMANVQYRRLVKELGAKKVYASLSATGAKGNVGNISYSGVQVDTDTGPCVVIAGNKCPALSGFALTKESWVLASLGPIVKPSKLDGLGDLRVYNDDALELRAVSRGNLGCKAPIYNARILLPSV